MTSEEQLLHAFTYYARLGKVKEYVDQHLAEPIALEDAARVASLEPKYFSRFFKEKTGVSFSRWLHDQRTARAMELLDSEDITVDALANRLWLFKHKNFSESLQRKNGRIPLQLQKACTTQYRVIDPLLHDSCRTLSS
jgi:two-component system response regulator YesN